MTNDPEVDSGQIPAGARLPRLAGITVSEVAETAETRPLGGLPMDTAERVARILNTVATTASSSGPLPLPKGYCPRKKPVTTFVLTLTDLQPSPTDRTSFDDRNVATVVFNDDCPGFILTAGKNWYASWTDTSLFRTLYRRVLRPVTDLPQPDAVRVTAVSAPYAPPYRKQRVTKRVLGTLNADNTKKVWTEISNLGATMAPASLCPELAPAPQYELSFVRDDRIYATAAVWNGCGHWPGDVDLKVVNGSSYHLTFASNVLETLGEVLHRATR